MNGPARFLMLLRLLFHAQAARILLRVAACGVALTGALAVFLTEGGPGEGWSAFADAASLVLTLVAALGAILGAAALSQDHASGALRAILLRPVPAHWIVAAHLLILEGAVLLLYGLGLGVAALAAHREFGFGPITYEEQVLVGGEEMLAQAVRLLLGALPALLISPVVGVLASLLVRGVAPAVVVGLLAVLGPLLATQLSAELPASLPATLMDRPLSILQELAQGITLNLGVAQSSAFLTTQLGHAFLWGLGLTMAAAAIARRRELSP